MPLRLVADERIILDEYHIRSPWYATTIELPYLSARDRRYRLGPVSLRVEEVLNDIFETHRPMKRGAIIEGVILAYGCVPIPEQIGRGPIPVQITLIDSLRRETTAEVNLLLERTVKGENVIAELPMATGWNRPK